MRIRSKVSKSIILWWVEVFLVKLHNQKLNLTTLNDECKTSNVKFQKY